MISVLADKPARRPIGKTRSSPPGLACAKRDLRTSGDHVAIAVRPLGGPLKAESYPVRSEFTF
jgi:hypothetical protein